MEVTLTSDQAVIARARELGRTLGASNPFRDYERALERYEGNPSAASLLEEIRRVEQEASMQEILWGDSGSEWAKKLDVLQERVKTHPAIRALRQAETELVALFLDAVVQLGEVTGIDYAEACTGRSLSGCGPPRPVQEMESALLNAPEVQRAVEALGYSITHTAPYRRFEEARSAFQNDAEVTHIREQMKQAVEAYVHAQRNGSVTLDVIQDVRSVQSRLREHPVVQDFSRKRQEVHEVFQVVNQAVGEILGIDVAQAVAPAAGCCG